MARLQCSVACTVCSAEDDVDESALGAERLSAERPGAEQPACTSTGTPDMHDRHGLVTSRTPLRSLSCVCEMRRADSKRLKTRVQEISQRASETITTAANLCACFSLLIVACCCVGPTVRRARFILGWVTVCGQVQSQYVLCNQPPLTSRHR